MKGRLAGLIAGFFIALDVSTFAAFTNKQYIYRCPHQAEEDGHHSEQSDLVSLTMAIQSEYDEDRQSILIGTNQLIGKPYGGFKLVRTPYSVFFKLPVTWGKICQINSREFVVGKIL